MKSSIASINPSGLPTNRFAAGKMLPIDAGSPALPRDGVAAGSPSQELTYQQLLERNRQLEGELAKARAESGPIRIDPAHDRLTVDGLKTPDYEVEHLQVKVSALGGYLGKALSLETLLAQQGQLALPPIDQLASSPMTIDALKLRIPGQTLQKSSQLLGADAFERNGLKELTISPEENGKLRLRGSIDKLIDIPFDISGELSVADGNEIHFKPGKTRVFGILPVPNLVVRIAASLAGKDMEEVGVKQKGDTFVFDVDDLLPKNIQLQLTKVSTDKGALVLEGQAPQASRPAPEAHNPTTLASFE